MRLSLELALDMTGKPALCQQRTKIALRTGARRGAGTMTQYWPFSGFIRHGALRERLIVSLDLGGRSEALKLADQLLGAVGMFKVGKTLYRAGGPEFVREMRRRGAEVFLDLKFHDTPGAMVRAALEATRLGARMFDLHLYGSTDWIERVRNEVARLCHHEGLRRPHIIAVAMLADASRAARDQGARSTADSVVELAKSAAAAGLDGVFTSPPEVARVRAACGRRFVIVTSGQLTPPNEGIVARATDAAHAIRAGADYLVIGGRFWRAPDPARAVRELTEQIERALRSATPLARETPLLREP
jgi:orotidine-5'-phosphate decarboxylase